MKALNSKRGHSALASRGDSVLRRYFCHRHSKVVSITIFNLEIYISMYLISE